MEQLNLQRQLEIVQQQQQQILQQQQQLSQQAGMGGSRSGLGGASRNSLEGNSRNALDGNSRNTLGLQGTASGTLGLQGLTLTSASNASYLSGAHRRSSSSTALPSGQEFTFGNHLHKRTQSSASYRGSPEVLEEGRLQLSGHARSHSRSQSQSPSFHSFKSPQFPAGMGHARRHSLGITEARRAAAEAQAQRVHSPSKLGRRAGFGLVSPLSPPSLTVTPAQNSTQGLAPPPPGLSAPPGLNENQSFKFPAGSSSSPQRRFQFPASQPGSSGVSALGPPQPSFAEQSGGYSGHRRLGSASSMNSASGFSLGHHRKQGSYGGSASSITQFQNGQRKSLFAPYLPQNSLPELIGEGRLVTGTLRVNKKNRSDAYVSTNGLLDADIFICGSKDRNRALEGDLVAVELLVVDEVWTSKREKEEKKRIKDYKEWAEGNRKRGAGSNPALPITDSHNDATESEKLHSHDSTGQPLNRKGSLKQRPTQKKNDDVEVEGQSLLLAEEEEISDVQKPLYAGHIVAVIDRIPGQLFSGTLGLLRPSQASKENKNGKYAKRNGGKGGRPKIIWFKPTDKKVPLIAIPTEQAPKDFVENHETYADQIFVASIKRWPITSLHPFGTLVSLLGPIDDPQVEVTSILRDNNFQGNEYPDRAVDRCLSELPRVEDGLSGRRDLLSEYVLAFSQNGVVSEAAMHVKVARNNRIELGVHIADVTYFVGRNSGLDKRARKRSHGVALPQKTVGLFPDDVSQAFSFDANKTSLALSVVFEISSATFEIQDVWMGQTVVKPAQKVSYEEMDEILGGEKRAEGEGRQSGKKEDGRLSGNGGDSQSSGTNNAQPPNKNPPSAAAGYVATLQLISDRLRKKRLGNPGLNADVSTPLLDRLDDESVRPSLNIYTEDKASEVLAEIFHAVNAAVAQKIHSGLGSRALLRKYPMPTVSKFEAHLAKIERLGVKLDTTNSVTFQNSLLTIQDPLKRSAVETILAKCMPKGRYVVAGRSDQNLGHFLFNSPTYTHFTSPLRRYADLVVHRQLKSVVCANTNPDAATSYAESIDSLKVTCDYCNFKKDCARAAQEQAIHLLLCQTVNDMGRETGQILCTGVVLQVYESSFDVYLPEFGIEKRVHGDQLPLRRAEFDKTQRMLELYWEPGVDSATYVPEDENNALSYRASIKNKYRAPAQAAAKHQAETNGQLLSAAMLQRLQTFHQHAPSLFLAPGEGSAKGSLAAYMKLCVTKMDGDEHIQQIKVMQRIPVLLRAEIGMALPCLTVRTLNPFVDE